MARVRYGADDIDPSFACRLCQARPHDENCKRVNDPGDSGGPLGWLTPDCCANCVDVLTSCYSMERAPGQRFADLQGAGHTLMLIKRVETDEALLTEFLERKVSYNLMLLHAASARPDRDKCGQTVFIQQIQVRREQKGAHTWYEKKDYERKHGDLATNGLGHAAMKRDGKDVVAVFDFPASVVRVIPETVTYIGNHIV